jgi:hypothetical protein
MESSLTGVPVGVVLSPLAREVFRVLQGHTAFPWPVLSTQCKRHNLDLATFSPADLILVIPHLASGVGRFTSPAHEAAVRRDLQALTRGR